MNLKNLLQELNITSALFDADDTFFFTTRLYDSTDLRIRTHLLAKYPLNAENLLSVFREIQGRNFAIHHVDPVPFWTACFDELKECLNLHPEDAEWCLTQMLNIQLIAPEIIPGALETVQELHNAGIRMGVVTHASEEWTRIKFAESGLMPYFEHFEVVPLREAKGTHSWAAALSHMGIDPHQTLAAGDNLKGDVGAAREAGIRYPFWINHHESWDHYKQGVLPEGAYEIESLADLFPRLLQIREQKLNLR